jgi:hypothetical protein
MAVHIVGVLNEHTTLHLTFPEQTGIGVRT